MLCHNQRFVQMCLLIGTVCQVSDVAHGMHISFSQIWQISSLVMYFILFDYYIDSFVKKIVMINDCSFFKKHLPFFGVCFFNFKRTQITANIIIIKIKGRIMLTYAAVCTYISVVWLRVPFSVELSKLLSWSIQYGRQGGSNI